MFLVLVVGALSGPFFVFKTHQGRFSVVFFVVSFFWSLAGKPFSRTWLLGPNFGDHNATKPRAGSGTTRMTFALYHHSTALYPHHSRVVDSFSTFFS